MLKKILFPFLLYFSFNFLFAQQIVLYPGITGKQLRDSIAINYKPINVLSYDTARDTLYGKVDIQKGFVYCLYTGDSIAIDTASLIAPRTQADNLGYSTEHAYPQSKGAGSGSANSNMHHLFPVRQDVNASRNNLPYKDVPDSLVTKWYRLNYSQTTVPDSLKEEYSRHGSTGFEVRDVSKGNVARAVFYFFTMYQSEAENADPDFFNIQLRHIRRWHFIDAPDSLEYKRNEKILHNQSEKINPFIIDTTLVKRAYGVDPPQNFTLSVIDETHMKLSWIKNIYNDNVIIVRNQTGVIEDPSDGVFYLSGHSGLNGFVYVSNQDSLIDTLPQLGTYYYKIFSLTDSGTYSVSLLRFTTTGFTDAIHYWNFNNNPPPAGQQWGNNIPALSSNGLLVHSFSDVESFQGTILNSENNDIAGGSFSPKGMLNNDSSIVLSIPTTNFKDIIFSYTTRGTSTGYNRQSIFYSVNGINFDSLTSYIASNFDWVVRAIDFTSITPVNDNPLFKIKIIVRGASTTLGNNRFDNFKIIGNDMNISIKDNVNPLKSVIIFPNPATDFLNIRFSQDKMKCIVVEIFSNMGSSLYKSEINNTSQSNEIQINTNNLSQGLYFLKIQTSNQFVLRKFVVYR